MWKIFFKIFSDAIKLVLIPVWGRPPLLDEGRSELNIEEMELIVEIQIRRKFILLIASLALTSL